MFSKSKTQPSSDAQSQDLILAAINILTSFSQLTDEQLSATLSTKSVEEQTNLISSIETMMAIPAEIYNFFMNDVGYPSKEAAIRGIHAYADGKVRKLSQKFSDSMDSFMALTQGTSATIKPTPEEETKDDSMAGLERLAKIYVRISDMLPRIEKTYSILCQAREDAQQTATTKPRA